jgi:hypothetical protein
MDLAETTLNIGSDVTAWDKNEHKLLVSQVRARDLKEDLQFKIEQVLRLEYKNYNFIIPFGMTVTRQAINFYSWDSKTLKLLFTFSTEEVLSVYEPEFGVKRIFEYYLETLIEGWLRDLAYGWKTNNPPKLAELEAIGFVDKLSDANQQR